MSNGNRLSFCEARGPLTQIIDVLAGKNGRLWARGINEYLRQGAINAFGWKIFGPYELRLFESVEVLMAAIDYKRKQYQFYFCNEDDIRTNLNQCIFPLVAMESVEYIGLTVKELGFDKITTLSEIEECLPGLGLSLCGQADAARIFTADDKTIDEISEIKNGIFLSKPFMQHLRGQDDPLRPFLFEMSFDNGRVALSSHWREDKDEQGNYPADIAFYPGTRIILRVV
jgi:hypothetical protein